MVREVDKNINFSEIVGLLNEPNRPSWWKKTIREVILHSFIWYKRNAQILEIGSNTWFSSIEFGANLPDTTITWIDINPISIRHATKKKDKYNLKNVSFIQADGQKLPFKNDIFDLVFSSNTTSFIKDKELAVNEYYRVLQPNGILATVPIYYIKEPPLHLVERVEEAIGTKIDKKTRNDWDDLFKIQGSEVVYNNSHRYKDIPLKDIENYTNYVIKNAKLDNTYSIEDITFLREKLLSYYVLFNENLQYCGFDVILLMKNYPNIEPELYFTY